MKYHLVIWTDDGIKREFDCATMPDFAKPHDEEIRRVQIIDTGGKAWFFNWNHVLGGTIQEIKDDKD